MRGFQMKSKFKLQTNYLIKSKISNEILVPKQVISKIILLFYSLNGASAITIYDRPVSLIHECAIRILNKLFQCICQIC